MAQEWYLMKSNHDMVSGFETDIFNDFAKDSFEEVLGTSMAADIEICNYDLSIRKKQKAILQGNTQDTSLNSTKRSILITIGSCKAGDYVYYKDRYWLIEGLVDDNGIYEKAVINLCNYLLTWKSAKGNIVQRWARICSASQYNNGETSTEHFILRSDQLMIRTPCDNEVLMISHRQRFIIDARCKVYEKYFSENTVVDTSNSLITYGLTRADNVIYDYQDSGYFEFIATQEDKHENDGYYVIDGKGYWLCDVDNDNETYKTSILSCHIDCDEPIIYSGLDSNVFIARFYDSSGNEVKGVAPLWELDCDFSNSLNIKKIENMIYISTDDNNVINKSFKLSLSSNGYERAELIVKIKAFI